MTRGTWREQYDRTQRWYERFAEINAGKVHDRESEYYRDDVHSFFMACYHLKDWLKNDPTSGISAKEVEGCVNASFDLCLCGDMANGVKHMKLTRTPRVSQDTAFGPTLFKLELSSTIGAAVQEPTRIAASYEVLADGKTYDAFEVATGALEAWKTFLGSRGLLQAD